MAKRGIDISEWQGDMDFSIMKNQVDFIIIRVGYGTKGSIDSEFRWFADNCTQYNIPIGFYWYSYALDVDGAEKEARAFLNAIKPYHPTMGCWFDMEDADGYKASHGMPSNDTLKEICYKWCEMVEDAGYYAGTYASLSWFRNQLAGDRLSRFDKWVAMWPTSGGKQRGLDVSPDEETGWSMWQFTSDGWFEGYDGRLDVNYAYHEFPNPGDKPTPTPPTPPEPTPPEPQPTPPEPEPTPTPEPKFKIGDEVIVGGPLYVSSDAELPAGYTYNTRTTITRYEPGAAHPYNTEGDLGWMDESSIRSATDKPAPGEDIVRGCLVKFLGTKSYSGIPLDSWTHGYIFNVIEVSGDRVVIGKGQAVTAAVNIKDCQRVY